MGGAEQVVAPWDGTSHPYSPVGWKLPHGGADPVRWGAPGSWRAWIADEHGRPHTLLPGCNTCARTETDRTSTRSVAGAPPEVRQQPARDPTGESTWIWSQSGMLYGPETAAKERPG